MSRHERMFWWAALLLAYAMIAYAVLSRPADAATTCAPRMERDGRHWTWREIDGRRCWYAGRAQRPKSSLHWPRRAAAKPGAGAPPADVVRVRTVSLPTPPAPASTPEPVPMPPTPAKPVPPPPRIAEPEERIAEAFTATASRSLVLAAAPPSCPPAAKAQPAGRASIALLWAGALGLMLGAGLMLNRRAVDWLAWRSSPLRHVTRGRW